MSHRRKEEENKRLKKLHDNKGNAYYDEDKKRYIRYYDSGRKWCRKKALKRASARAIRYSKDSFQQHNRHKRLYEYWWSLF